MAAETATDRPVLSFPREIFAALQPRQFLQAHLSPPPPPSSSSQQPVRPNGRQLSEWRKPTINTNSLTHCHGSAVVRCGDTAVVCGVRGEILRGSDIPNPVRVPEEKLHKEEEEDNEEDGEEVSNLGLLVPNIELSTGSAPAHLPGSPPSTLAQALTNRLLSLLNVTGLVRASDLRILFKPGLDVEGEGEDGEERKEEIKAYWVLYLDILFISLDGSAFDAAWIALLAALRTTVLPKAWWDPDLEMIVCSDDVQEARRLRLRGLPVPATLAVFEGAGSDRQGASNSTSQSWVLAEPDTFEESLCKENITVTVDGGEGGSGVRVRRLEKAGGGTLGRELIKEVVASAAGRWKECREIIVQGTG